MAIKGFKQVVEKKDTDLMTKIEKSLKKKIKSADISDLMLVISSSL